MNKSKLFILLAILFSIFGINESNALINNEPLLVNKIIYIDPGHGGKDPGAVYKELKESDINLKFAKKIGEELENLGCTVFYTRDGDYDLSSTTENRKKSDLYNRVKLINESKSDMYISIHVNSETSSTWYGAQVFYSSKNTSNIVIAEAVQKQFEQDNISKRKVAKIENIYMYDKLKVPGVLLEIGFISNYSDRKKMQSLDYINKFSSSVVKAIYEYLK